jgi:zinc transporter ZupT
MRQSEKALLDICLGFAGGVMLAASYWSLLEPAFGTLTRTKPHVHQLQTI